MYLVFTWGCAVFLYKNLFPFSLHTVSARFIHYITTHETRQVFRIVDDAGKLNKISLSLTLRSNFLPAFSHIAIYEGTAVLYNTPWCSCHILKALANIFSLFFLNWNMLDETFISYSIWGFLIVEGEKKLYHKPQRKKKVFFCWIKMCVMGKTGK